MRKQCMSDKMFKLKLFLNAPALNLRFFSSPNVNLNLKHLTLGSKATVEKSFSFEDVNTFARLSEDFNPIHVDKEFIKSTKYEKPIVHGMLVNGLFSGLLAKQFGAGALLMELKCQYLSPVFIDVKVIAESEVTKIDGLKVTTNLKCYSTDNQKLFIKGEAAGLISKNVLKRDFNKI